MTDAAPDTAAAEPEAPPDPNLPALKTRKVRGKHTAIGAFTSGARVVKEHCYDVSKYEAYIKRYPGSRPINGIQPFLPNHDFARDYTYLELTRHFNYFDIEACKWLACGNDPRFTARAMLGDKKFFAAQTKKWRLAIEHRMPTYKALIEHFRGLLGQTLDPGSYTVDEAMRSLITDIRTAKPGKERSDLTYRLIDMLGMEKDLKSVGSKLVVGNTKSVHGAASAEAARALAGVSNGSPTETD